MADKPTCTTCQYFKVTGHQDFYNLGQCQHPKPALGGAMVLYKDIAEFLSCYQHKKVRKNDNYKSTM